jgi:hypothetical protein
MTLNRICTVIILLVTFSFASFAQTAATSATLPTALAKGTNMVSLATCPTLPQFVGGSPNYKMLVDSEVLNVTGLAAGASAAACVLKVQRGVDGTIATTHAAGAVAYFGAPADFGPDVLFDAAHRDLQTREMFVPASQCEFAPTTLTTTNTRVYLGTSVIPVLNGVSNAAAGTLTLVCHFLPVLPVPSPSGSRGVVITDIVSLVGSQTVAPTSLGTATLGTITWGSTLGQAASTVAPVTLGGTTTTITPTALTTVTTAGSFLGVRTTFGATPAVLLTDLQTVVFTLPIVQSAASAMTINTPGVIVHYTAY